MSWVDSIPGSGARQFLQSLNLNFVGFHKDFCKVKNAAYFNVIADLCEDLLGLVEADKPSSPELVANLVNSINTQLKEIIHKKEGTHNQREFDDSVASITQIVTKLRDELQAGMRVFSEKKQEVKSDKVIVSTVKMRKALVDNIPKETLMEQIELLRDVPTNNSCKTLFSRAFFKHRIAAFGGIGTFVAGSGAVLQSGLNIALNVFSTGCQGDSNNYDPRILLPTTLFALSGIMFTYALVKSKPPASLPKAAVDQEAEDNLKAQLLPLDRSLSF